MLNSSLSKNNTDNDKEGISSTGVLLVEVLKKRDNLKDIINANNIFLENLSKKNMGIENSESIKFEDLMQKLFENNKLEILTKNDWEIDRTDKLLDILGIDFLKLHNILKKYYVDNELNSKNLITLHLGPGNGKILKHIEEKLDKQEYEESNFTQFGIADKLYVTIESVLLNLLKEEYRDKTEVQEIIDVIVETLNKKFAKKIKTDNKIKFTNKITRKEFLNIFFNLRNIGKEQPYRNSLIHESILKGEKFEDDSNIKLSKESIELLTELRNSPFNFLKKYFKKELLNNNTNFFQYLTVFPKNIILMKFQELYKSLEENQMFNIIIGGKSTSHLNDMDYGDFLINILKNMKKGAVYVDDGIRESYTDFLRIDELEEAIEKQNKKEEFKTYFVYENNKNKTIKSFFIHRKIKGNSRFPIEMTLHENHKYISLEEFKNNKEFISNRIKNQLLEELKVFSTSINIFERSFFEKIFLYYRRKIDKNLEKEINPLDPPDHIVNKLRKGKETMINIIKSTLILMEQESLFKEEDNIEVLSLINDKKRTIPKNYIYSNSHLPNLNERPKDLDTLKNNLNELKKLSEDNSKPIIFINDTNDFSNELLEETIKEIIPQGEEFIEKIDIEKIEENLDKITSGIIILNSAKIGKEADEQKRIVELLIEKTKRNPDIRILALGNYHNLFLENYNFGGENTTTKYNLTSEKQCLEFGALPIRLSDTNSEMVQSLRRPDKTKNQVLTGVFINDRNTTINNIETIRNEITSFGYPYTWTDTTEKTIGTKLPPLWLKLGNQIIISSMQQGIQLSKNKHKHKLIKIISDLQVSTEQEVVLKNNLNLIYTNKDQEKGFIANDHIKKELGPHLLLNELKFFSEDLLRKD